MNYINILINSDISSNCSNIIKYIIKDINTENIPISLSNSLLSNIDYYITSISNELFIKIETDGIQNIIKDKNINISDIKDTKIILLIEFEDATVGENFKIESKINEIIKSTLENKIFYCPVQSKNLNLYLEIIYNLNEINTEIIDKILIEEYGKQSFKKIDSNEKKINKIKKLIQDKNIINEWMKNTGCENLKKMFKKYIFDEYNNIVNNHINNELMIINKKINDIEINDENNNLKNNINLINNFFEIINFLTKNKSNENESIDLNSINDFNDNFNKILNFINSLIINIKIYENIQENEIDDYLNCINTYNKIKNNNENNQEINIICNELIKKKLLLTFDDKLFLSLWANKIIDDIFFKECIGCSLKNNPDNFYSLINFANTHSNIGLNIIIDEYINLNNYKSCTLNSTNFIESLIIICNSDNCDMITFSKLLFKFIILFTNDNFEEIKIFNYLLGNYIKTLDLVNNSNLPILNIHFNLTILLNKHISGSISLVDLSVFEKIYDCSKLLFNTILKIFKCDSKDSTDNLSLFDINNFINSINYNYKDKNDDDDDDEDEIDNIIELNQSGNFINFLDSSVTITDSDSSTDIHDCKTNSINKIYNHIINSSRTKNIDSNVVKKISEIYFEKTNDYNDSINLYETEKKNRLFRRLYNKISKELN